MAILLKVLAVLMVLAPAVYPRVLRGWPAAVDDFQDQPEEPVETDKKLEERNMFSPSDEYETKQGDNEGASSFNNQGYFKDFVPKSIVLDDNESIEARFAYPDFPKFKFPFDEPYFGSEKKP